MSKPEYEYRLSDCDVSLENRSSLEAFRAKRETWLTWLRHDEHHAISDVISSMLWSDASFRILSLTGEFDKQSCLHNQLLAQELISGHFATQTLAIRRLMDERHSGVISLANLLKDIAANIALFTRENFVCFDGLPYDVVAAEQRVMAKNAGGGSFYLDTSGPDAWDTSRRAHEIFDKLSGIGADKRSRADRIPKKLIEALQAWLNLPEAESIVDWTHNFLAHAADHNSRSRVDMKAIQPSLAKITVVARSFVRVAEALTAYLLFDGGHGSVMPVPQFDPFEYMDKPMLSSAHLPEVGQRWDSLAKERDDFLENILEEMVATPASS